MSSTNTIKQNGWFTQLVFILSALTAFVIAPIPLLILLDMRLHPHGGSEFTGGIAFWFFSIPTYIFSIFCLFSSLSIGSAAGKSMLNTLSFWFSLSALISAIISYFLAN